MRFTCFRVRTRVNGMLTLFILCGLSTLAWFFHALLNRHNRSLPNDNPSLDDYPKQILLVESACKLVQNISADKPPWIPVDAAALHKNFASLKLAAKIYSASQLDRMMKHKVPVFSTTNWRLHTPSGTNLSIEFVQRAVLSGSGGCPVPNVAHYILPFHNPEIEFHHMVSILSCIHVMKPQLLFLWYAPGRMAHGKWWDRVRSNLTASEWENRIVMATRPLPDYIYTTPVVKPEHKSDIMRMEALLMFGGAYFDVDVIVLKPLQALRKHQFTIGRETHNGLCNGAFLSAPNSTFLAMWHTAYQTFNPSVWNHHSVHLPHEMHKRFPELCHVEEASMDRPNWTPEQVRVIYGMGKQKEWNWKANNYALHLWFRKFKQNHDMDSIKRLDSIYGEVCRFILYGSADLL